MKELPEMMMKIKIKSRQDYFERRRLGQKRRRANKEKEKHRKEDPNFCMEIDGEVVRLTDEFLKEMSGPLPPNVWAADLENNPKLRIHLDKEEGDEEVNEEVFDLLFERAEEVETTYTIKNWETLGAIDPKKWPIHPHIWIQGIRNWARAHSTATGSQINRLTWQLAAAVLAAANKPMPRGLAAQIHHPMVSRTTRVEGAPDCRAEWWKLIQEGNAVNPLDSRLQSLWAHMANLTGSDPSFRLSSPKEKIEVKKTLEASLDCREKEEQQRQWRILLTQTGFNHIRPEDVVI